MSGDLVITSGRLVVYQGMAWKHQIAEKSTELANWCRSDFRWITGLYKWRLNFNGYQLLIGMSKFVNGGGGDVCSSLGDCQPYKGLKRVWFAADPLCNAGS